MLSPDGTTPWRKPALDTFFEALLRAVVTPEEATRYSLHSFRIYLACALLAAKVDKETIKQMLRWRSDEAMALYARVNIERDAGLRRAAQRMQIDSIRTSTLDRLPADSAGRQETAADLGVDRTAMLRNEALLARAQQANVRDVDPKREVPYDANYLATAIHEGMARP